MLMARTTIQTTIFFFFLFKVPHHYFYLSLLCLHHLGWRESSEGEFEAICFQIVKPEVNLLSSQRGIPDRQFIVVENSILISSSIEKIHCGIIMQIHPLLFRPVV